MVLVQAARRARELAFSHFISTGKYFNGLQANLMWVPGPETRYLQWA